MLGMYLKGCTLSFAAHHILVLNSCPAAPCMLHTVHQDSRACCSLPYPLLQPALLHCTCTCMYLATLNQELFPYPANNTATKSTTGESKIRAKQGVAVNMIMVTRNQCI